MHAMRTGGEPRPPLLAAVPAPPDPVPSAGAAAGPAAGPGGDDPAELDDLTLVVRAREGDVRAFSALAARHQAALYRLALRLVGNAADAEDALQDGLLDAWRHLDRFRGDSSFPTWAYRIVTNRCLDLLRRRRSTVPVDEVAEPTAPDSPAHTAEVDAGLAALRAALATLPDDLRACFVLRELEGLGYAEIAEITGASETAVRGRIHRARKTLAGVLRSWR